MTEAPEVVVGLIGLIVVASVAAVIGNPNPGSFQLGHFRASTVRVSSGALLHQSSQ